MRFIIPTVLSVLLLLLITFTILVVLGNLNLIYWHNTLNTVFIPVIVPVLGVIIALAQWLHTLSSREKENKNNLPEQPLNSPASNLSLASQTSPNSLAIENTGQGKSVPINITSYEEDLVDMGEAPHVDHFYGRVDELATLQRWIVDEHCHLVSIIGIGGIGKTSLVAKLIDQNPHVFRAIFWRSLLNAPPIERILQECLQFLIQMQGIEVPQGTEEQIRLLVAQLRERRCLLILDNAEAILKSGSSTAEYKNGYEEYGKLVRLLGETRHQSCLVMTSREQLREIALLEGEKTSVHTYRLQGLKIDDARIILEGRGLVGERDSWKVLVERFSGNPLMLTLISPKIRESYHGLVSQYLMDFSDVPLNEYPDVRALLDDQFERLSSLEQHVFYWLAIEREAVTLQDLRGNFVQPVSKINMLTAIEALQRRSWIEQSGSRSFTLQPAMMEAVTDRFNEIVVQEIIEDSPKLFASHALIKAQAKNYIRESQFQLILNIIVQRLSSKLDRKKLEKRFRQRLAVLRRFPEQLNSYEAGNILNLLVQAGSDLRGYDFSRLTVRQAYLPQVELPEVNFAYANLATSVFTDTFGSVHTVALGPHGDLLAAGTGVGEIRLWYAATGLPLRTLRGHTGWVCSLAFSSDGKILASASDDQTVRLWELSSGQCLSILHGHSDWVRSVAFSPDGKILASGSMDQMVRLWEINSSQCLTILQGHANPVRSVTFSPDGKMLASGSDDQTIRLWEISSGQCLNILQGFASEVFSVAFSPDGKTLVSGSMDQAVRLWDLGSGQCLSALQGHGHCVCSLAFSPDGRILASGSVDQTVRLWDLGNGQCLHILHGHTNEVRSVAFSPDGKTLASGSVDQTVRLWEVERGWCLYALQGYANAVFSIGFSPDGNLIASGNNDQRVHLWDVGSGQYLHALRGHTSEIRSVAFSPNGKILASGGFDQTIHLWMLSSNQCFNTLQNHSQWLSSVAFSPDGKLLASGSFDQTVRLWEVSTGQCLRIFRGHTDVVESVAFSPDGEVLASGGEDRAVRLWNVSSGQCLRVLRDHGQWVSSVAFSPNGMTLVSGSGDQTVRLWEVESGQCLHTLYGHAGMVRSVAFSYDGKLLASGSHDQTVRLWETSSGQCLHILRGHVQWVSSVAFSPDGNIVASGSYDGTINFWNRQTGVCSRTLRSNRLYEGMDITLAKGLTETQKATLKLLGAIEEEG